jgi:DNA-binding transcriptional LysR family regulator
MVNRKTNLNQLRILSVLVREPNLSRASDILGVSQPTLSAALKQLRDNFHDPLLVRVGNRMELTAKAKSLIKPLDDIFEAVDLLWEAGMPEPEEATRSILIGTNDYGTAMTAAPLLMKLLETAPGITVQYIDVDETKGLINRENELDFYLLPDAVCHLPVFQDFKSIPLYDDEMVYMVGNGHRLARQVTVSSEEIDREHFAIYDVGVESYSVETRKVLSVMEMERNILLRVQQFSILPSIACETNAVVILPRRLAEKMQSFFDCKILGALTPAFEFSYCLIWNQVHQSDRVHEFVRRIFKEIC